ncbi:MAG: response regulator [Flavitalea sp.]
MQNFKDNPIFIVDEDKDDLEFIAEAIRESGFQNNIEVFNSGEELLSRLKIPRNRPFIILCELNLQVTDGIEVRKMLAENLPDLLSSIPFVFWSSSASPGQVRQAYKLWSQGVFLKPSSIEKIGEAIQTILKYWTLSGHPA